MLDWLRARAARWLQAVRIEDRVVRGIPVRVINTRPDIVTDDVFRRIDGALGLIEQHLPWHFRRLRRDFRGILSKRFACRGAYFQAERICLVELTFAVNPSFTLSEVAATILHEAMHARLHVMGVDTSAVSRAREERFCRRAEIELGRLAPDGERVLARAMSTLTLADEEVAPAIDWSLAERRVREVDEGR